MSIKNFKKLFIGFCFLVPFYAQSQEISTVGYGWANNSVNAVIFRKNAITTHKKYQFISYYNQNKKVVIGKRKINDTEWEIKETNFTAKVEDAHCSISMIVDGDGYIHLSWGHHGDKLKYVVSKEPLSLDFTDQKSMTGLKESKVTYPEFYNLENGNLLFLYRDGSSGNGDLLMNVYNTDAKKWTQVQSGLISGEKRRNAYWQATTDQKGTIHLSWVWRESADVASNHDMCYARSKDGGITWEKSTGEKYNLPITAKTAEYACIIPQNSELINQTSMTTDQKGNPYIASYWRDKDSNIPQYRVIYLKNEEWKTINLDFRKTPFSLSGIGTKRIPIARPQILIYKNKPVIIFRDEERGNKISIAYIEDLEEKSFQVIDLSDQNVGLWEPSYDTNLWQKNKNLAIYSQKVEQVDGEGKGNVPATRVEVVTFKPTKRNVQELIDQDE